MAWTVWTYQAGPAGSLETLTDYCVSVRSMAEYASGKRGVNPIADYRHGEVSSPRKYVRPLNILLETVIAYVSSTGGVTHADGPPGHFMENLGHVKRLIGGTQGALTRLQRVAPDESTQYADVEMLAEPTQREPLRIYQWPLRAPHPFWVGTADTGNTAPTLTVAGTAPIGDAVINFTGTVTDVRLTHSASSAYVEIAGALPAGGVTVDIGAGTATKISGGADYSNNLVVNNPWWMELDSGANTVAVTEASGSPTVTVDWVTQWR